MRKRIIPIVAMLAATMFCNGLALAADDSAEEQPRQRKEPTAAEKKAAEQRQNQLIAQRKAAAKIKLVSLNGASAEELKTLPGIGDDEAKKIIAGRPYGSKTWLVTKKILGEGIYEGIRKLVVAGTPSRKDAAKNPEVFGKKP